jgi:putative FmdB family regulatory protein
MPNYVYRGTDCQHEFEVYQSFAEDPLTDCTECGQPVRRVFHPAGLVFKGSGWYVTDSRGKPSTTPAAGTDAKKDATPAATPAATATAEPAAPVAAASKDA